MKSEVAWVLISSGTQGQPQIILDPDYLLDYLSVSYDYYVSIFGIRLTSEIYRESSVNHWTKSASVKVNDKENSKKFYLL